MKVQMQDRAFVRHRDYRAAVARHVAWLVGATALGCLFGLIFAKGAGLI